jgi:arylsulfatase A-like enzyme
MREHSERHSERPFFLFLNYNDAHDPYFPEETFARRFVTSRESDFNGNLSDVAQRGENVRQRKGWLAMTAAGLSDDDIGRARELHLAELAYADDGFGELLADLEELSLMEETLVVCLSDHGELFGEHGRMSHGGRPVDELLHVPLVMVFPDGKLRGRTVDARVDLRDVKPTVLDYLGIEDATSRGRSLLPLLRGQTALPPPEPYEYGPGGGSIKGQDPETQRALRRRLRALGYLESE